MRQLALALPFLLAATAAGAQTADPGAELRAAATRGDLAQVRALLDAGVDVNARTDYGATALSYAADKGHAQVVKLLLERGAEVDPEDTFYHSTPITWAGYNGHAEVVELLIAAGAKPSPALAMAVNRDKVEVVKAVLASGKLPLESLAGTLAMARTSGKTEIVKVLEEAGVKPPPPADATVDAAILAGYAGRYTGKDGLYVTVALGDDGALQLKFLEQSAMTLGAVDATRFRPKGFDALTVTFKTADGKVTGVTLDQAGNVLEMEREAEVEAPAAPERPEGGAPPGSAR